MVKPEMFPVKLFKVAVAVLLIFILFTFSCGKDNIHESPPGSLRFSADTVLFDTVFTLTGSATQNFKIYNPHKNSIIINSLYLAGGVSSPYRINVDGIAGDNFSEVEIRSGDSLFVFVEVTIDRLDSQDPLVVKDSIVFVTGGGIQDVKLISWGQDVHVVMGATLGTQTLTAGKPYLVYDYLKVEAGHLLTIEPGTRIYFHKNARMYVEGTVEALGTSENPVVFEGGRLETGYRNIPGQWEGIWLMPGSMNNRFINTRVRNAINGIIADSLRYPETLMLYLANSRIENMTYSGIFARSSAIYSYNTIISNCGRHAVITNRQGNYRFFHCTIANYWNFSFRNTPSVMIYSESGQEPLNIIFGNSIIHGLLNNEIQFTANAGDNTDVLFDHCIVNFQNYESFPLVFRNCITNRDPGFIDGKGNNFRLDENSPAIDAGDPETGFNHQFDFAGRSRILDDAPDIGAFEFEKVVDEP